MTIIKAHSKLSSHVSNHYPCTLVTGRFRIMALFLVPGPLAWFYTKLFFLLFSKCWCQIILEWKVLLKKLIYNWFTSRYFWTLTTTAHYCFIVVSYKPACLHTEFGDKVKHKLKPFPSQYKWVLTNNSTLSTGLIGLLQSQTPVETFNKSIDMHKQPNIKGIKIWLTAHPPGPK